jgi:hypothetical protein
VTKLDKPLRREVEIDSKPYTLTLSPYKLKLTPKGHRHGVEVSWAALLKMGGHEQPALLPAVPLP